MDKMVCPGCNLSIEPIRIFEQSKKSKQWWRITKCPRERCGFNIDIDECDKPGGETRADSDKRYFRDDTGRLW